MLQSKFNVPSLKEGQAKFVKSRMAFWWPSLPSIIPHRLRRRIRSRLRQGASPASSLASLQTSFDPFDAVKSLRQHRWTRWDLQYIMMVVLLSFSAYIIQMPGPFLKSIVGLLLCTGLVLPITRQFVLPCMPIFTWLIFFYGLG
jgi:hypothetical protein